VPITRIEQPGGDHLVTIERAVRDSICCVVRSRLFDWMRVRLRNTFDAIRG
jgi:hypothetical protein